MASGSDALPSGGTGCPDADMFERTELDFPALDGFDIHYELLPDNKSFVPARGAWQAERNRILLRRNAASKLGECGTTAYLCFSA
jgi:hypothetical protein